jgi:hypothetical protein
MNLNILNMKFICVNDCYVKIESIKKFYIYTDKFGFKDLFISFYDEDDDIKVKSIYDNNGDYDVLLKILIKQLENVSYENDS